MSPRRVVLAVLAGTGVVLAACSSSPSTPERTTTTAAHAASSTTSSSTTTTSSAPSSTTSSTAVSTACNHVTAVTGQSQGAAGTITGIITVTNAAAIPCSADGYPTVALFSGSGAPLTVTMVNGLSVSISPPANAPPGEVALAASGSARFAYQFSDVPVGNETSCPGSEEARVTMPGAVTPSPTFALAIDPCGNGTIRVSPVYAPS